MNNILKLSAVFISVFSCAMATVYQEVCEDQLISCTFSSEHHNRIFFKESSLVKVLCPKGVLDLLIEESSGHAYISSNSNTPKCVTVSAIDNLGRCQDIKISFAKKDSEILVLEDAKKEVVHAVCCNSNESVLKSFLSGKIPNGYTSREIDPKKVASVKGLERYAISSFDGGGERILFFHLHNREKCLKPSSSFFISSCDFSAPNFTVFIKVMSTTLPAPTEITG